MNNLNYPSDSRAIIKDLNAEGNAESGELGMQNQKLGMRNQILKLQSAHPSG